MTATERVLAHFDRISEAPDAVGRLRRFVLDLAVRGKLVDQGPGDEPALALLGAFRKLAAQTRKGASRVADGYDVNHANSLFQLPSSWTWCRLSDVGMIVAGGTPPSKDPGNFASSGEGIPWLTPADLGRENKGYVSRGARDLSPKGLESSSATLLPKGSVLFTSRAPIGYTAIAANEISTNQGFKSVVPYLFECGRYIALYFRAFAPWIDERASGTTFREVSGKVVAGLPFPLPPLAEQHRIVAKVDELMALCDRLEASLTDAAATRHRLLDALLADALSPAESRDIEVVA
jgi:type I restriction enzyme S subunit